MSPVCHCCGARLASALALRIVAILGARGAPTDKGVISDETGSELSVVRRAMSQFADLYQVTGLSPVRNGARRKLYTLSEAGKQAFAQMQPKAEAAE